MTRLIALLMIWAAATQVAAAGPVAVGADLQAVVDAAPAGAVIEIAAGVHRGPLTIDKPLVLSGLPGAVLQGDEQGSVLTVDAPGVTVRGLTIQGSGSSHETKDAGITLLDGADGVVVENNSVLGNLYGIDIHGADDAEVRGNVIEGRQDARMNARGNGIYVWNAPGAVVEGNDVRWGRDGIFVNTSKRNVFRNNRFRDLRFAVHYMYANQSEVSGNVSIGNHLGFAVMYSRRVTVTGNVSIGDRDHGVMLNYTNQSEVTGNLVLDGEDKCLFVYNAHKNQIEGNRFERCGIGIHFTAGSERNAVTDNAFIGNRTQVKYVSTKWVDWATDGRGNYWSDHVATDLDADGIGDAPYWPNDSMDHILWRQPAAKLLLGAPAVQLARWTQSQFPALRPGGIRDTSPLMQPVEIAVPEWSPGDG